MTYSINRLTILLIILIFAPAILPFGTNGINLIEIIAFLLMPFSIFYYVLLRRNINKNFLLVTLFLFAVTCSYIFGALVIGRGFSEPLTMYIGIIKILAFYFLGYVISSNSSYFLIQNNSKYFFFFIVSFGVVQVFFPFGKQFVDMFYHSNYWNPTVSEAASFSFYHPVNYIFGLILFGIISLQNENFLSLNNKSLFIVVSILFFSVISSVLTIIGGFILLLFLFYKNRFKYVYSIVIGSLLIWVFLNIDLSYELSELRKFTLGLVDGSYHLNDFLLFNYALSVRFEHTLLDGFNLFLSSPLFGIGPGGSMDSFYVDLLASYGLIGGLIFFLILRHVVKREQSINKTIVFIIWVFVVFSTFQKPFIAGKAAELFWLLLGILDKTYHWRKYNVQISKI